MELNRKMIICNFAKGQGLLKMPNGTWENKTMHVEYHYYCGPVVMTKDWHESAKRQPDEGSLFWDLMQKWRNAIFAVDKYGHCVDADGERLNV